MIRKWLLRWCRPRSMWELNELLPDSHFETVGARRELVIYTGWRGDFRYELRPMLDEAV